MEQTPINLKSSSCSCCQKKRLLLLLLYSFFFFFFTFNSFYNHCHFPVSSSQACSHHLSCIFPLLHFLFLLLFPFLFVYLLVLVASAQAPPPPRLRARLCLPPVIGQSVPTLARSVCRPRRQTMQVHGSSITNPPPPPPSSQVAVAESLHINIILLSLLLPLNNQTTCHLSVPSSD